MIPEKRLEVKDIRFAYRTSKSVLEVIRKLDLTFESSTISVILGPSGCGKTTLLNLIAGVLKLESGTITYYEKGKGKKSKVGYVFQTPSLIPWRTVKQNVLLGAEISRNESNATKEEADRLLAAYGLKEFANSYPSTLSGGMQQRVSIIRAVMSGANILLLDEPFSNTDLVLRRELQKDLLRLVTSQNLIAVMVTHDLIEAVKIADQIIILSNRPTVVNKIIAIKVRRQERMDTDLIMKNELYKCIEEINQILVDQHFTHKGE